MKYGLIGTWRMCLEGLEDGLKTLEASGDSLDAVEMTVRSVEDNPEYISVGYGGLPNEKGVLELDAGFMNGDDLSIGGVCGIRDFKNPVSIARRLMDEKYNNILVGPGAEEYASKLGFERRNMLTDKSRKLYEERVAEEDPKLKAYDGHDTVGIIGLDKFGKIVAATSTSGLFMKRAGRIGDSPIPGSGYYANSEVGACVATGLGEDILKGSISYEVVRLMEEGLSSMDAAVKAVLDLDNFLKKLGREVGDISVVCMDKDGEWGAATNAKHFSFVVGTASEKPTVYLLKNDKGKQILKIASQEWIASNNE